MAERRCLAALAALLLLPLGSYSFAPSAYLSGYSDRSGHTRFHLGYVAPSFPTSPTLLRRIPQPPTSTPASLTSLYLNSQRGPGLLERGVSSLFDTNLDVKVVAATTPTTTSEPSIVASTSLVIGTVIGAGALALPSVSLPLGLYTSTIGLLSSWLAMTLSALLCAEITLNAGATLTADGEPSPPPSTPVTVLSASETYLPNPLPQVMKASYLILHFFILTAYTSTIGEDLSQLLHIPEPAAGLLFTSSLVLFLTKGNKKIVDTVNSTLVGGCLASFLSILTIGLPTCNPGPLLEPVNQHPELIFSALPIFVLSLVFHNVIPRVCTDLEYNVPAIRKSIIIGSAVPLILFLGYDFTVLGNVASLIPDLNNLPPNLNAVEVLQSQSDR